MKHCLVSDSAKVVATWSSQGASEPTRDNISCDIFTSNHVFSRLILQNLLTVATINDIYHSKNLSNF